MFAEVRVKLPEQLDGIELVVIICVAHAVETVGVLAIAIDDNVTYIVDNPLIGTIDGTLYFQDGSRLEFTEQISLRAGRPVK